MQEREGGGKGGRERGKEEGEKARGKERGREGGEREGRREGDCEGSAGRGEGGRRQREGGGREGEREGRRERDRGERRKEGGRREERGKGNWMPSALWELVGCANVTRHTDLCASATSSGNSDQRQKVWRFLFPVKRRRVAGGATTTSGTPASTILGTHAKHESRIPFGPQTLQTRTSKPIF